MLITLSLVIAVAGETARREKIIKINGEQTAIFPKKFFINFDWLIDKVDYFLEYLYIFISLGSLNIR